MAKVARRLLACAAASVVLAVPVALGDAGAFPSRSGQATTVDRTFVCATTRVVVEGYPDSYVSQGTTVYLSPPTRLGWSGARVAGGVGISDENSGSLVAIADGPATGRPSGGIWVNPKQCTSRRGVRVPLSAKGLPVRPDRIQQRSYDCDAPRRIHVRVRAVLSHPRKWKVSGGDLVVRSPRLRDVQLAVRTASSKPLAYGEIRGMRGELSVSRKSPRCVAS